MLRIGSEFSKVVEGYAAYGETIAVPSDGRLRKIVVEACAAMGVELQDNHEGGKWIVLKSGVKLQRQLLYALVPVSGGVERNISVAVLKMLKQIGPGRLWLLRGTSHMLTARAADSVPDGRITTRSGRDGDHLMLAMYYWHEPSRVPPNPWAEMDVAVKRFGDKLRAATTDKDQLYWGSVKLTTSSSYCDGTVFAKLTKVPTEPVYATEPVAQYAQPVTCDERGYHTVISLVIPDGFVASKVKAMVVGGRYIASMDWNQNKMECSSFSLELVKGDARHATLYITSRQPESWSAQMEYLEAAKPVTKTMRSTDTVAVTPQYVSVPTPPAPLDQVIDGTRLRDLIRWDEFSRREEPNRRRMTPRQRAAISAHWSAELRRKVEAKRVADATAATSVRYCEVEPWE